MSDKKPIQKRKIFKDDLNDPGRQKVWVSSGSTMINLMLSGDTDNAYLRGRFVNIVGDESTGKTLFAEELVNRVWHVLHIKRDKKVVIIYDEPEAAFDMDWAIALGLPVDDIIWLNSKTVDDFHAHLWDAIRSNPDAYLLLYILDSLDALQDAADKIKLNKKLEELIKKEQKARKKLEEIDEEDEDLISLKKEKEEKAKGTFGAGKAKGMSEFFRNLAQEMNKTNCLLFIISQTRDNIGVMFGEKQKRSGGKALDFYASQVFWIHVKEKILSKKSKIVKGIRISAYCKKNKVAPSFRKVNLDILWKYGFDNYGSVIDFLYEHDALGNGSKIEWNNKKYYRDEFRIFLDNNPKEWQKIISLAQDTWNIREEEAKVDLKPKYSLNNEE